jgi:hypothetical protein
LPHKGIRGAGGRCWSTARDATRSDAHGGVRFYVSGCGQAGA